MLFIFDIGGVITSTAKIYPRLCEILGISLEDFYDICGGEKAADGQGNILEAFSDGKINFKDFQKIFLSRRPDLNFSCDYFHMLFHPKKIEGSWEIVGALKKKGHRVVAGTNTIESYYLNHLERGDYQIFDQTYTSHFLGCSKPDPDFWKLILLAENVDAKDAVFVDDREENVKAALSLGIKSFKFESAEKLKADFKDWL